jgi:hypothetical protein
MDISLFKCYYKISLSKHSVKQLLHINSNVCCAALSSKLHVGSISAFLNQGSVVSELDNNKVMHFSYVPYILESNPH